MRPRLSPMLRDLAVVAAATMVTNVTAYLISFVAAARLAPAEFGAFGSLLSLSVIGSTVALAAQAVAARRSAGTVTAPGMVVPAVLRSGTVASCALGAAGLVCAPVLAWLLDVSVLAVAAALLSVAVTGPAFTLLGVVQGREHHVRYGAAYATLGVARAAATIAATFVVPTAEAAALGMLAGAVLGSFLVVAVTRVTPQWGPAAPMVMTELRRNVGALVGLYALTNIDVVLARVVLPATESGHYALGSLVAKAAFFLPSFIAYVLFPRMAAEDAGRSRRAVILLTAGSGLVVTVGTALVAPWFTDLVGGATYADVTAVLWLFALQGSLFAVIQGLLYVRMSGAGSRAGPVLWGGLAAFLLIVILVSNESLLQVVGTSTGVGLLIAVVIVVAYDRDLWTAARRGSSQVPGTAKM